MNSEGDEIGVITTGDKLATLDQNMGGGLPLGTANLAVGAAAAGKSVISRH